LATDLSVRQVYLGLIYHLLTGGQSVLKALTICGLLISSWFAVGVRKTGTRKIKGDFWYFVLLIAATVAAFLVAAQILLNGQPFSRVMFRQ
jgi:hypothetical protein